MPCIPGHLSVQQSSQGLGAAAAEKPQVRGRAAGLLAEFLRVGRWVGGNVPGEREHLLLFAAGQDDAI
jgi:hypothetical protein